MRLPWYNDKSNVNVAILNDKNRKRLDITSLHKIISILCNRNCYLNKNSKTVFKQQS